MSKTIQPCSWATLSKEEKDPEKDEPQTEDNRSILLSIIDNLNKLSETVNKLDNILEKKRIEQMLYQQKDKTGGEK